MSLFNRNRVEVIPWDVFFADDYNYEEYKKKRKYEARKAKKRDVKISNVAPIPIVGWMLAESTQKAAAATPGTAPEMLPPETWGMSPGMQTIPVMASEETMDKIAHAFDPLIDLMVNLSLPIAGVMLTGGALLIMIGQKEMGYRLIMNCSLGYVLVQMSPLFIDMLASVGKAI